MEVELKKLNDMITIDEVKKLREKHEFTHVVVLGIDSDGSQHVATHGKSSANAKQAADLGNQIKRALHWPSVKCNEKPLSRICSNCDYWQRGYHIPGTPIEDNQKGQCMFNPDPIVRFEKDIACGQFLPII